MRTTIGCLLITCGMAVLPHDLRILVRGILLYHVPGALSDDEKAEVRAAKAEHTRSIMEKGKPC